MKKILQNLLLFTLILIPSLSFSQAQRYYTKSEALKYLFKNSKKVTFEKHELTTEQIKKIQTLLKTSQKIGKNWTVYIAKTGDTIDGYAIIDNIIGKEEPITFAVSITPQGTIQEVEILVYRESHGGQVKNKAYRDQFVGKSLKDSIKNKRDIRNVSGATISSTNIAYGAKRALAVWSVLYRK